MAKFKIQLVTSVPSDTILPQVLLTTITDYWSQSKEHEYNKKSKSILQIDQYHTSFSFTYDENLQISKNAQKTLKFSMLEKVWSHNEWIINPFTSILRPGVQLLLTDKNDQEFLFTVVQIDIKTSDINTEYQVTCNDSFTYQTIRQNEGYIIKNDPNDLDFIGAKDIDWWVENKIAPECYLTYEYVPLKKGLVLLNDNQKTLDFFDSDQNINIYHEKVNTQLSNIKDIIKPIYDQAEFAEMIPFSISGSNGSAALINLASQLGLMLRTYEHTIEINNKIYLNKFFWFEPEKHLETTGLVYSPNRDVKDFNLTFDGTALTTVLNVHSTTVNDEEISLLPNLPLFFNQIFSSTWWNESKYYPGMFQDLVDGEVFEYNYNEHSQEIAFKQGKDNKLLTIQIPYTIKDDKYTMRLIEVDQTNSQFNKLPIWYDIVHFNYKEDYSYIKMYTSKYTKFFLVFTNDDSLSESLDINVKTNLENPICYFIEDHSHIPANWLNSKWKHLYIGILDNNTITTDLLPSDVEFNLFFTRATTQEEKDFAKIADECPWLENKLIDFSYFLDKNIISKQEYQNLMDLLTNNLRIYNGQLMVYATVYFKQLQEQVNTIAAIQSDLDLLGAAAEHEIIQPLMIEGSPDPERKSFKESYNHIFKGFNKKISILNYKELKAKYLNQFINSEQTFLKNLFLFEEFFNSKVDSNVKGIYKYTITASNNHNSDGLKEMIVDFHANSWSDISYTDNGTLKIRDGVFNFTNIPVELKAEDFQLAEQQIQTYAYDTTREQYYNKPFVTYKNYTHYFLSKLNKGDLKPIDNLAKYSSVNNYFLSEADYKTYINSIITDHEIKEFNSQRYIKMKAEDLTKFYLRKHLNEFYIHSKTIYTPWDWIRYSKNILSRSVNARIIPNNGFTFNDSDDWNQAWSIYKSAFPLSNIYYYGKKIIVNDAINNKDNISIYNFERVNEYDFNQKTYEEKIKNKKKAGTDPKLYLTYQPIPFYSDFPTNLPIEIDSSSYNQYVDFTNNNQNKFPYYSLQPRVGAIAASAGAWAALTVMPSVIAPWLAPILALSTFNIASWRLSLNENFYSWNNQKYPTLRFTPDWKETNDKTYWQHNFVDEWEAKYTDWDWEEISKKRRGQYPAYKNDSLDALYALTAEDALKNFNYCSELHKTGSAPIYSNWEYFNYYGLLAATYSFEWNFIPDYSKVGTTLRNPMTVEGGLYVKNKYLYWLHSNYLVNKKDDYRTIILAHFKSDSCPDNWEEVKNKIYATQHSSINTDKSLTEFDIIKLNKEKDNPIFLNFECISAISFYFLEAWSNQINMNNFSWENKKSVALKNLFPLKNSLSQRWIKIDNEKISNEVLITEDDNHTYTVLGVFKLENEDRVIINDINSYISYQKTSLNENEKDRYALDFGIQKASISYQNVLYEPFYRLSDGLSINIFQEEDFLSPLIDNGTHSLYLEVTNDENFYKPKEDSFDPTKKYYSLDLDNNYHEEQTIYEYIKNLKDNTQPYSIFYNIANTYEEYGLNDNKVVFKPQIFLTYIEKDNQNKIIVNKQFILNDPKYNEGLHFTNNICHFSYKDINENVYSATFNLNTTSEDALTNDISNGNFWFRYHNSNQWPEIIKQTAIIEATLTEYWDRAYHASKFCQFFLPETWTDTGKTSSNKFASSIFTPQYEKYIIKEETGLEIAKYGSRLKDVVLNYKFIPNVVQEGNKYNKPTPFYKLSYANDITNNPIEIPYTLKQIFEDLNVNPNELKFESLYNDYYYYYTDGGLKWKDLCNIFLKEASYDQFGGLDEMMFKILSERYQQLISTPYQETLKNKQILWKQICTKYPNIILEKSFSNESARTSKDLWTTSKIAFKGQMEPEKAYNISVIYYNELKNYNDQPLNIGDSIALDFNEYTDEFNDIQSAIKQLLFITDLSYSLRSDNDLKITVNSIKYQDKLIQQLVKLMR